MKQKYTDEMKQETVMYILETGKSYSEVSRELGLGKGTLYKWVSAYKQKNGIVGSINKAKAPASNEELVARTKELEKQLKEKDKEIEKQKTAS